MKNYLGVTTPIQRASRRDDTEPLNMPDFDDPDVQVVYKALCNTIDRWVFGSIKEHWEGRMARRIIQQLRTAKRVEQSTLVEEQPAPVKTPMPMGDTRQIDGRTFKLQGVYINKKIAKMVAGECRTNYYYVRVIDSQFTTLYGVYVSGRKNS